MSSVTLCAAHAHLSLLLAPSHVPPLVTVTSSFRPDKSVDISPYIAAANHMPLSHCKPHNNYTSPSDFYDRKRQISHQEQVAPLECKKRKHLRLMSRDRRHLFSVLRLNLFLFFLQPRHYCQGYQFNDHENKFP